jgi:hypothetical protein
MSWFPRFLYIRLGNIALVAKAVSSHSRPTTPDY